MIKSSGKKKKKLKGKVYKRIGRAAILLDLQMMAMTTDKRC